MKNGLERDENLDILNFCFKIRYAHLEESSLVATSAATWTKWGTSLGEMGSSEAAPTPLGPPSRSHLGKY